MNENEITTLTKVHISGEGFLQVLGHAVPQLLYCWLGPHAGMIAKQNNRSDRGRTRAGGDVAAAVAGAGAGATTSSEFPGATHRISSIPRVPKIEEEKKEKKEKKKKKK
ncbi:hypothetical protein M0802_009388 [Mischocyttarus mexicanus]|nr:hypothetical protein M0802_009388 [Mischocyttarus mexicanus]